MLVFPSSSGWERKLQEHRAAGQSKAERTRKQLDEMLQGRLHKFEVLKEARERFDAQRRAIEQSNLADDVKKQPIVDSVSLAGSAIGESRAVEALLERNPSCRETFGDFETFRDALIEEERRSALGRLLKQITTSFVPSYI